MAKVEIKMGEIGGGGGSALNPKNMKCVATGSGSWVLPKDKDVTYIMFSPSTTCVVGQYYDLTADAYRINSWGIVSFDSDGNPSLLGYQGSALSWNSGTKTLTCAYAYSGSIFANE